MKIMLEFITVKDKPKIRIYGKKSAVGAHCGPNKKSTISCLNKINPIISGSDKLNKTNKNQR